MSAAPPSPPGDRARVEVFVAVERAVAFDVFTREIDLWWRRGPKYRVSGKRPGVLQFEPRAGGRLFETIGSGTSTRLHEIGTVRVWDPPARLVFEWRGVNFRPGESTEVEVVFEEARDGTRVRLTHTGFAALRPDHPVRHGLAGADFVRFIGLWWGELLSSFREHGTPPAPDGA